MDHLRSQKSSESGLDYSNEGGNQLCRDEGQHDQPEHVQQLASENAWHVAFERFGLQEHVVYQNLREIRRGKLHHLSGEHEAGRGYGQHLVGLHVSEQPTDSPGLVDAVRAYVRTHLKREAARRAAPGNVLLGRARRLLTFGKGRQASRSVAELLRDGVGVADQGHIVTVDVGNQAAVSHQRLRLDVNQVLYGYIILYGGPLIVRADHVQPILRDSEPLLPHQTVRTQVALDGEGHSRAVRQFLDLQFYFFRQWMHRRESPLDGTIPRIRYRFSRPRDSIVGALL